MRPVVILFSVLVNSSLLAQGSVDMLKGSSDAGQRAFDQRVARGASPSQPLFALAEVDVAPEYPGGMEALNKALLTGCDTSIASTGDDCNKDFHYTVHFTVEPDGTITQSEVKGAVECPVLISSTLCRIGQLQPFRPGSVKGSPVRTRMEVGFDYDAH